MKHRFSTLTILLLLAAQATAYTSNDIIDRRQRIIAPFAELVRLPSRTRAAFYGGDY